MVLVKRLWLNISLCLRWPLTSQPGDASVGTQSSHPRPETPCIFNEVILAGGWRLQSVPRDWHLLALFS